MDSTILPKILEHLPAGALAAIAAVVAVLKFAPKPTVLGGMNGSKDVALEALKTTAQMSTQFAASMDANTKVLIELRDDFRLANPHVVTVKGQINETLSQVSLSPSSAV